MILGIQGIEESSVYQDIFAEGRAAEARRILLGLGGKKPGQPDERILALVAGISDPTRLHLVIDHILDVESWEKLLAKPDS